MAGCIFSAPSEGKGLVVVNIFFGLVEPRLNHAASEFHQASLLYCKRGAGHALQVFPQRNMLLTGKSRCSAVICVGVCMYTSVSVGNPNLDE